MATREQAAGMFITDGHNVLLLKRNEPEGHWSLPGGHADKEGEKVIESPIQTARRETQEEIGKVPSGKRIYTSSEKYDDYDWTTYIIYVNKKFGGIKLSKEHTDYVWMPFDEASNYNLHPKLAHKWSKYLFHIKEFLNKDHTFKEFFYLDFSF